jgi:hypothetical protein
LGVADEEISKYAWRKIFSLFETVLDIRKAEEIFHMIATAYPSNNPTVKTIQRWTFVRAVDVHLMQNFIPSSDVAIMLENVGQALKREWNAEQEATCVVLSKLLTVYLLDPTLDEGGRCLQAINTLIADCVTQLKTSIVSRIALWTT